MDEKLLQSGDNAPPKPEDAFHGDESSKMNHVEEDANQNTECQYRGPLRKGSDLMVLGVLLLAPFIGFGLLFSPCGDTVHRPNCFQMHLAAMLCAILFVATFVYRSYEKFRRRTVSRKGLGDGENPSNLRSFGYCCLHTVMEMGIVGSAYVQTWFMDGFSARNKQSDYQSSITDFAWVSFQIWLVGTVAFVCGYYEKRVALQIPNTVFPHGFDIAFGAVYLNCLIPVIYGLFRLWGYAWTHIAWTTPLCLALALACEYLVLLQQGLVRWWRWLMHSNTTHPERAYDRPSLASFSGVLTVVVGSMWLIMVGHVFANQWQSDYHPSVPDFILLYGQIWLCTLVIHHGQWPLMQNVQTGLISSVRDVIMVTVHAMAIFLSCEGHARLFHYANNVESWWTVFFLLGLLVAGRLLIA